MKFIDLASASEYGAKALGFEKACCIGKDTLVHFARDQKGLNSCHAVQGKINILSSPDPEVLVLGAKRFDLLHSPNFLADMALLRKAVERKKPFEIPLRPILASRGVERARLVHNIAFFLSVCNRLGAEFAFTSRAENAFEARAPLEIASFAEAALGLSKSQALYSLSAVPGKILKEAGKWA